MNHMQRRNVLIATIVTALVLPSGLAAIPDGGETKDMELAMLLALAGSAAPGELPADVPAIGYAEGVEKVLASDPADPTAPVADLIGPVGPNAHADVEPNNTCGTATTWPTGLTSDSSTGTLTPGTDTQDYSRFEVLRTERITVSETPPSGSDYDLGLYDPSCVLRASSVAGGSATDTISNWPSHANGFWRERVYIFSAPAAGTYSVSYSLGQTDAAVNSDAGSTSGSCRTITAGTWTGSVGRTGDDDDWYCTNVPARTRYTATIFPDCYAGFDADLFLHNNAGTSIDSSTAGGCAMDEVSCDGDLLAATTVRLDVDAFSGKGGYTLVVRLDPILLPGTPACG